jgi:NTP pyrophosphatase (non-canonical NTP hydrolase)
MPSPNPELARIRPGTNDVTPQERLTVAVLARMPAPPFFPSKHFETMPDSLADLARQLDRFAKDRDWQQFHSPKNLASALVVEAGELLEHFQWLTQEQSRSLPPEKRDAVGAEVADVLLYLIQLASALGIDPITAAQAKLKLNAQRYPADLARGSSAKHDQL